MMSLSFLDDLWRVRVELTGISPDGAVRVEKAFVTPDPPWMTVRGATRLPITSGAGQVDSYEYADQVENWYRVIRVDPPPGLLLDGTGDYASTPDAASLDITGDLDLRCEATLDDWASGSTQVLVAKLLTSGDERSFQLSVTGGGELALYWFEDGGTSNDHTEVSGVAPSVSAGSRLAVRAALNVSTGGGTAYAVDFYTAPTLAGPWEGLGTQQMGGSTTSINSGAAALTVGAQDGGAGPVTGTIHAAEVYDGIDGTLAANPDFTAEESGTASFDDDAGRTWTVQGDAEILGEIVEPAQSITPDNQGLTILKSVTFPALNRSIGEAPEYRPVQRSSRTGVFNTKGRVPPTAVYDSWTSRWWTMEFVTNTLAEARDMDLVLAASRTLFIQAPPESANECFTNPVSGMPGGYVMAQNATMRHTVGGSHVMQWVLPVRQVAPPVPEVSGGTLTWQTLMRLYGSWTALWASAPSWQELWETIGDPEDAISP